MTLPFLPPRLGFPRRPPPEEAKEEEAAEEREAGLTAEEEREAGALVVERRRTRSETPLTVIPGRGGTGPLVEIAEVVPEPPPPLPASVQALAPTVTPEVILLNLILDQLQKVNEKMAVQTEPKGEAGALPFDVKVVDVTTTLASVNDVVQGPSNAIPRGFETMVRMRRHAGSPNGYVSFSKQAVMDTRVRMEFKDNDSIYLTVGNWDRLFFGADTFGTNTQIRFELAVERNPRKE